jgi:hypothetical protein
VTDVETLDHAFKSATAGDTDGVDLLTLLEDSSDLDFLLEISSGEIDLLGDVASIDLNFDDLSLLCFKRGKFWLGVGDDTDESAFFLHGLKLLFEELGLLGSLGLVFGESILNNSVVLIESTFAGLSNVAGPSNGVYTDSSWGDYITNNTCAYHGWGIENCDTLNDLLENLFISGVLLNKTHDVGAACLVRDETS